MHGLTSGVASAAKIEADRLAPFASLTIDFKPPHDAVCRQGLTPRRCFALTEEEISFFWRHFSHETVEKKFSFATLMSVELAECLQSESGSAERGNLILGWLAKQANRMGMDINEPIAVEICQP